MYEDVFGGVNGLMFTVVRVFPDLLATIKIPTRCVYDPHTSTFFDTAVSQRAWTKMRRGGASVSQLKLIT